MANNDLLVESSLAALPKPAETKQQVVTQVTPAFVVSEQKKAEAVPNSLEHNETAFDLSQKVDRLNAHMQNFNRTLQFSVDEESGESVVKVIDSETNELVRQIPSEDLLDIRHAAEKYRGILLETKA